MPRHIHPQVFVLCPPPDLLQTRPELGHQCRQLAQAYADGKRVPDTVLQAIGGALWQALGVAEQDFAAACQAAGAAILPLAIHSASPALHALPWETLYHPHHGFLGKHPHFTLSRQTRTTPVPRSALGLGPLRVLLFTSLPQGVHSRLNVEEEQAQVQEALLPWIAKGQVELEMPDDGRLESLQKMLHDFQPHLLFLSGHGSFHHAPHEERAPYGVFFCEDAHCRPVALAEETLAQALIGSGVQAVVVSACESSKSTPSLELAHGLAQRISAQGIPFVIGMREAVLDIAGIAFARALCDALARGERLDFALQAARIAIQSQQGQQSSLEQSGQWCLPLLFAHDPGQQLIDWQFTPQPPQYLHQAASLGAIALPPRFIGRRHELQRFQMRLQEGSLKNLLLLGPGGQGKTSLAGKLARDMQAHGHKVFAYSARLDAKNGTGVSGSWRDFLFEELEMALDKEASEKYDRFCARVDDEAKRAQRLYTLLLQKFSGRLLLFLDNLESLQDAHSHALTDRSLAAWLDVARATPGVQVLATSRWLLPGWESQGEESWHSLERANYADFLQLAQRLSLPAAWLQQHHLAQVHQVLAGNCRGLVLFAAAIAGMDGADAQQGFLERLEQTKEELQADMAIEAIVTHLPPDACRLLQRLPNYTEPVPQEGIVKLGLDLANPQAALHALLAVSLLEVTEAAQWEVWQYQCAPLVADWLHKQGKVDGALAYREQVADYHLYLLEYERDTPAQAITAHHALRRAERHAEADRLTLAAIVGPLTMAGSYTRLLQDWLPPVCQSQDDQTRASALGQSGKLHLHLGNFQAALPYLQQALEIHQQIGNKAGEGSALNNISQIYDAQGNYDTALSYLKQSLTIRQQIGDKKGEGTTLNNISQIYHTQGDYDTALSYLKQSLTIQKQIGDKAGEGTTLNNISQIYDAQGNYDTALSYLKQSLTIRQQIGDKAGEGVTLNNISQIYDAQGDYDTALSYLKQSLTIHQQIGDKAGEGGTLNNISQIFRAQGDYDTALSYLKQSLTILQQIGDKAGEGTTLNNISQIYDAQGDYDTALSYLKQSLTIRQQIGDKAGEGATLNNISQIFRAQGDYDTALSYLKQSLTIRQQIGDKAGEGATLNNLATLCHAQGDYDTALSYLKQSLTILKQIGDKAGEGTTLNNISAICHAQGDYDTALSYLKQSLTIRQQIGDNAGLCATLFNLGHLHAQNEQMEEAFSAWLRAYRIASRINHAQVLQALASLAPKLGLPPGLEGWEARAQHFSQTGNEND